MKEAFAYVIGLGAAVMMPVIFSVLGMCIGIKPAKAVKSGLLVGVGFVGLGVVTALLTTNLGPALKGMTQLYQLNLPFFDLGWPAAAAVAYSCAVGAFIIPVCLGVNVLMLIIGVTRTVNIDLWNYWHFAFLGAMVFFATGSLAWAFYAAIMLYIITMCMADFTAKGFQTYYKDMEGISIPQPFCQSFTPFAVTVGWLLDRIPGFEKLNIDAEGLRDPPLPHLPESDRPRDLSDLRGRESRSRPDLRGARCTRRPRYGKGARISGNLSRPARADLPHERHFPRSAQDQGAALARG